MGRAAHPRPRAGPARDPRGAVAGDARRARRPRARLLGDSFLHPSLADIAIPFVSSYKRAVDGAGHHRRLDDAAARPLVLRPRPHRPAALAQAAPLHRAGLGASASRTRSARAPTPGRAWFLLAVGDRRPARADSCSLAPPHPHRPWRPPTMTPRPIPPSPRAARGCAASAASVVATAVAVFVALFSTIYVQMATGRRPGARVARATTVDDRGGDARPRRPATRRRSSPRLRPAVTTQQS